LKIEVKEGEGLLRELSVEIAADQVQTAVDNKLSEIRKTVTLKGFRKGKAPEQMIKSMYLDQAKADVAEELLKDSYSQVVREKELAVASKPTITALDFTDEGALSYATTVVVFPEVEKVTFDGMSTQTFDLEVSDKEVDDVVEHFRTQFSDLRELSREATATDIVMAELVKVDDPNNVMTEESYPDSVIDLDNTMTVKEFKEQLPGVKAGDEKEIKVVYADDYPDKKFAGASITYNCKIKSINERVMPDFDDAFAARVSDVQTALELRMKMRDDVRRQKEDMLRRGQRQDIIRQLCEKNEIAVPEGLVDEYIDSMKDNFMKSYPDADQNEVRERYRPVAIDALRWELLRLKLGEQEKIEVSPADTENWISSYASATNITVEKAREELNQSGRIRQLRDSILEEKVLDFLLDKADKVPAVTKE